MRKFILGAVSLVVLSACSVPVHNYCEYKVCGKAGTIPAPDAKEECADKTEEIHNAEDAIRCKKLGGTEYSVREDEYAEYGYDTNGNTVYVGPGGAARYQSDFTTGLIIGNMLRSPNPSYGYGSGYGSRTTINHYYGSSSSSNPTYKPSGSSGAYRSSPSAPSYRPSPAPSRSFMGTGSSGRSGGFGGGGRSGRGR